jgi:hypothetical protein
MRQARPNGRSRPGMLVSEKWMAVERLVVYRVLRMSTLLSCARVAFASGRKQLFA